ncbi:aminopeptidase [Deinococcus taeanensis]|uniref:aminopeptidase n=1 Tax=Deinococcus taeanensis TaxID=2737050 RepID=UPI001CDD7010|nr:aminopeptidase [Deinococcus taeanensis]UBV42993.1 aminopeptidase [Deinococcus taeanensis]
MTRRGWVAGALMALGAALLSGCADVRYLTQAAAGQLDLLRRARPVAAVLADPATPEPVRRKVQLAADVRAFAVAPEAQGGLGLPDHGAFLNFVDVGRPFVVWNVFSAPELSVQLDTSCFPVAGCVGYRGYFSEGAAQAYAQERRAAGRDVSVGGVSAYSTLGYLKDPLLSTMLNYPDSTLIRTVIHELAHPSLYVPGDTVFNESYATAVEEEGVRRWLDARGTSALRDEDRTLQARQAAFETLLLDTRAQLDALYAAPDLTDDLRRARKAALLTALNQRYAALKLTWGGYSGYDGFFQRGVNNASLGAVAAYATLVPDFQALLARTGGHLPTFIEQARTCGARPQPQRAACLRGSSNELHVPLPRPQT